MDIVKMYELDPSKKEISITFPKSTKILSCLVAQERLYAITSMKSNEATNFFYQKKIKFYIIKDLHPMNLDNLTYIGSYVLNYGSDVVHIFYGNI